VKSGARAIAPAIKLIAAEGAAPSAPSPGEKKAHFRSVCHHHLSLEGLVAQEFAVEKRLLGHWRSSQSNEICDWQFEPENRFVCSVRKGSEHFKVNGYWDILNNNLRIGTSELENETVEMIEYTHETFATRTRNSGIVGFERLSKTSA
jgi:hypothetical protein